MQKIKPHLFNRLSVLKLLIDNDNIVFVRQSSENSTLINAVFHTQFEDFKRFKIKPLFLCLAPEISGVHTPSLHRLNYGNVKLRVELEEELKVKLRV